MSAPPSEGGLGPELARAAEEAGVRKAESGALRLFVLGALAGAFIALGSALSAVAVTGTQGWPFGIVRLVAGLSFSLGLVLVLMSGAELFTGDVLMVLAWGRGRVRAARLVACWGWVLLGNALGAMATAALLLAASFHEQAGGAVGATLAAAAQGKAGHGALEAFALGVLCNGLVCVAVWCSFGARTLADRAVAALFPVTAFVALGLEHSIANLFLMPYALALKACGWEGPGQAATHLAGLDASLVVTQNLVPVLLGNVVGGSLLVAVPYAAAYRRRPDAPP